MPRRSSYSLLTGNEGTAGEKVARNVGLLNYYWIPDYNIQEGYLTVKYIVYLPHLHLKFVLFQCLILILNSRIQFPDLLR